MSLGKSELVSQLQSTLDGGGQDLGGRTAKIDLKDEGVIVIDGKKVDETDRPTDCTLTLSMDDLEALRSGSLNPMNAMMTGRLKISGDMAIAMKLQGLLEKQG